MNPGPHFPDPLNTPDDIVRLKKHVDVDVELKYVFDAITRTRHALQGQVPLIGFCGAPWTLVAYMIEGGGTKTFQKSKSWLFKHPEDSHALLRRVADVCVDFLVGQVKAGAQVRLSSTQLLILILRSYCKSLIRGLENSPRMISLSLAYLHSSISPQTFAEG
jgi:uroporphyrinogen-III decarboxylase